MKNFTRYEEMVLDNPYLPDTDTDMKSNKNNKEKTHKKKGHKSNPTFHENHKKKTQLPTLQCETVMEKNTLTHNNVHKSWAMITLRCGGNNLRNFSNTMIPPPAPIQVDFVVIIDVSASMKLDSKLAFVKATIEYLLTKLDENHRFSLLVFNHAVSLLAPLIQTTAQNKQKILDLLRGLQASGSTNISEALFKGLEILSNRSKSESSRISSIMLFTDGLSNRGLSTRATLSSLSQRDEIPQGCVINTFGYGRDHDSKMLHAIALRAKGVYYFVEEQDGIAATFGECVAGILSTEAHNITIKLRGQDGGRIVTLATPYPVKEHRVAKDYDVNLGLMYSGESKSILFKLSLRKMKIPMQEHRLVRIQVSYVNSLSGKVEVQESCVSVYRPRDIAFPESIPIELDMHINRYAAAVAITEAIELSKRKNFGEAQRKLEALIQRISSSRSANRPYCEDLVKDLQECKNGMTDTKTFSTGIHSAHAFSAMYYMERSTGSKNLIKKSNGFRNVGYGYLTSAQEKESQSAVSQARAYVSGYCLTY